MTMIDTGVTGAKRTSFRSGHPRETLARLIAKHPTLDADGIEALFNEKMGDRYLELYRAYWFANHFRSLKAPRATRRSPEEAAASVARLTARLLDAIVPGLDKPLRDASFAQCALAGGWLTKLSTMGKPRQIVGRVLSEEAVAAVFAK